MGIVRKTILLIGRESDKDVRKRLTDPIKKTIDDAPDPSEHIMFGDGEKTIVQLLEDPEVQRELQNANDDTLLIIEAHGMFIKVDGQRVDHFVEDGTKTIDILAKLPPNIKNVKIHACHSGSIFRMDVKQAKNKEEKEYKTESAQNRENAKKGRLIYVSESSKYSSLSYEILDYTIKFIENASSITPRQRIIANALANPLPGYISYDNPDNLKQEAEVKKLPRLFHGIELEDVKPDSIDEIMNQFVDKRAKKLLKLFPMEKDFIEEVLSKERDSLIEELKKRAPYLYADRNSLKVIEILAKSGANINVKDQRNRSILFYARSGNKPEMVRFLLNLKDKETGQPLIDPTIPEPDGTTILVSANQFNQTEVIKILLEDPRFFPNPDKNAKLLLALEKGLKNVVGILLKDPELDPNIKNTSGNTLLMTSYFNNKNNENAIKPFVENSKTNLNIQNNLGNTILHFTCIFNDKKITELLLNSDKKIDLTIQNDEGKTAFDIAYEIGNKNQDFTIHKMLLEKLEQQLIEACKSGDADFIEKALINHQIDPNIAIREPEKQHQFDTPQKMLGNFQTLLTTAIGFDHIEIVEMLLNHKADPNIPKNIITSSHNVVIHPLTIAVNHQSETIVQMLLDHEADPNIESYTLPLHSACSVGNAKITRMLLAKGAKTDVEDKNGITALEDACQNGHAECVDELLKVGAKYDSEKIGKILTGIEAEKAAEIQKIFDKHQAAKIEEKEARAKSTAHIRRRTPPPKAESPKFTPSSHTETKEVVQLTTDTKDHEH